MSNHVDSNKGGAGSSIIGGIVVVAAGVGLQFAIKPIALGPGLEINLGESLAMAGMMILLFPVIKTFFTTPLGNAIHERNAELEATFAECEALREQMTTLKADYEKRLAQTEAEARAQIQAEVKRAQELGASLRAEATQRADEMVAKAEQEIAAEKARALADIRVHVVDLSLAAAEKVIGENMDTERNRKLVEEFINTVEVTA